jgi:hypothetical protein
MPLLRRALLLLPLVLLLCALPEGAGKRTRKHSAPATPPQGSAAAQPSGGAMAKFNAAQQLLAALQRIPSAQREEHADAVQAEQLFDTGVAELGGPNPPQLTQLGALTRISAEYGKAGLSAARLRSLRRIVEIGTALPPSTLDAQACKNIGIAGQKLDTEFDDLQTATDAYSAILRRWEPLTAPLADLGLMKTKGLPLSASSQGVVIAMDDPDLTAQIKTHQGNSPSSGFFDREKEIA